MTSRCYPGIAVPEQSGRARGSRTRSRCPPRGLWCLHPEARRAASETERRADEAERETVKLKKVEYMSDRIGNVYTGVISGVTKWGMYVELPNTIEGLIHVANMRDDHYNYDESRYEMVGERTGKVYKLGQEVRVRVADTDRLMRTIDFVIAKERDEENGEDEW